MVDFFIPKRERRAEENIKNDKISIDFEYVN